MTSTIAGSEDARGSNDGGAGSRLESLVEWAVFVVIAVVAGFAVVAVPLAMAGEFRWYTVLFGTVSCAAIVGLVVRGPPLKVTAGRAPTAFVLLVIGLVGATGLLFPTHHFATNRDPGIYSTTGIWLAREGRILVDAPAEPFQGLLPDVTNRAAGFYGGRDDLKLYPQFAHLTHTLLGSATLLGGGPLLVRANVLVGAVGMVLLFVLAQQLARGWPAALATAAVTLSLPQVYFSRGPYSEPLAQLCVLAGVALLLTCRRARPAVAALSGLLLGAAIGSRIDGVLIGVGLVGALVVWRLQDRSGPTTLRAGWSFVGGFLLTGTIGIIDVRYFSPGYFGDLWPRYRSALFLGLAVIGIGFIVVIVKERVPLISRWGSRWRGPFALVLPLVLAVVLIWAWLIRPEMMQTTGPESNLVAGLQNREGVPVEPTRAYGEDTLIWFSWYLGVPLLVAAIAGAGVLARRGLSGRSWRAIGVGAVLGLPTLVYLWMPNITPDQIWAMRRFLPTGLPIAAVLGAVGLDSAWCVLDQRMRKSRSSSWTAGGAQVTAAVAAAAVLATPFLATAPFWDHQEVRFAYGDVLALCDALDGRPVLIDDAQTGGHRLVQTVTSICDVPAARVTTEAISEVAPLIAARWSERDEQLVVASTRDLGPVIEGVEHEMSVGLVNREIERTVESPPRSLEPGSPIEQVHLFIFSPT